MTPVLCEVCFGNVLFGEEEEKGDELTSERPSLFLYTTEYIYSLMEEF